MRLLLREPVESLGEPGDEVVVRAGYARNYLLPRRIAVPVTEENRRDVLAARQAWAVRRMRERDAAQALAESLSGRILRFERRVKTDSDALYGSVSVQDIARELAEAGFEIPRNRIILGGPIKQAGDASVRLRLHVEVEVELAIEVLPIAAGTLGVEPVPVLPPLDPDVDPEEPKAADEETDDGDFDDYRDDYRYY